MLFDNTDFNYEVSLFKIPGSDFSNEIRTDRFLNPEEGFLRGNLERGTYIPYRQYTYFKLKPENEQERLLLKLMALSFAINDLNLYLDLHPEDATTYELFQRYAAELSQAELSYAKKYGPMCVTETQGTYFDWVKNPWPWDGKGGSMYV